MQGMPGQSRGQGRGRRRTCRRRHRHPSVDPALLNQVERLHLTTAALDIALDRLIDAAVRCRTRKRHCVA